LQLRSYQLFQLRVVDVVTGQHGNRGRLAQVPDHVLHEPHVGVGGEVLDAPRRSPTARGLAGGVVER
jgi:hypothetical protein